MKTGYVNFKNRDFGYKGDKGTWAMIDGSNVDGYTLTVKKADKGIISSAYASEISEYAEQNGIDFAALKCGEKATVKIA